MFIDDGVYQLKKGQQTKGIEIKNFSPTYRALDGYDVEKLYVERESLAGARPDRGRPDASSQGAVASRDRHADGRAGRRAELLSERHGTMLHIVNKSPLERNSLDSCLRIAAPGGAVLLIEDGVYAATRGNAAEAQVARGARPASRSTRCCPTSKRAAWPIASSTA